MGACSSKKAMAKGVFDDVSGATAAGQDFGSTVIHAQLAVETESSPPSPWSPQELAQIENETPVADRPKQLTPTAKTKQFDDVATQKSLATPSPAGATLAMPASAGADYNADSEETPGASLVYSPRRMRVVAVRDHQASNIESPATAVKASTLKSPAVAVKASKLPTPLVTTPVAPKLPTTPAEDLTVATAQLGGLGPRALPCADHVEAAQVASPAAVLHSFPTRRSSDHRKSVV